jgi:hypothetical protein
MFRDYFEKTKSLFSKPFDFYEGILKRGDFKEASRFSLITGGLVALELVVVEFFSGGSAPIVAAVAIVMMVFLPPLMLAGVYIWVGFMRLCVALLAESLPEEPLRLVVAYSMAGFLAMGLGFTLGKWLSLILLIFQVIGVERMLKCSRWTAIVFVTLPFSIVGVLALLLTLIFKVF